MLVRHLLSHRAGLSGLREPHPRAQLLDWELTVERLAAQEPWWEPESRSGYHPITFGHLVGEVVRRASGLLPGASLEREVTGPLGIDFTIGLPEKESGRAAELIYPRAAEIPAANGHGTARAIAALYGNLAGRGSYGSRQVLSPEAAERVREGQGSCRDLVVGAGFEHETEIGLGL
jgi:CubicO group peptidase (beta-lactamase class C family)